MSTQSVMTTTTRFDLLEEGWLPVTLLDGRAERWGLRELFTRAHEARGLSEPSPLTWTATMRFLLAILHRAYEGPADPADWADIRDAGRFDAVRIDTYLDRYRNRFDLFHPERPFAQDPSAAGKPGDEKPITQLTFDRVSGNNGTLYDHSVDETPLPVSPGDAARLVLTAHQYGFAGAQIFRDTPMIAGYCLLLEGTTLFTTLVLNLQEYSDDQPQGLARSGDAPWWELDADPTIDPAGNLPLGLTDLLTWRGRRIQLVPDDDGQVRRTWYRPGYQLRPGERPDPFKRNVPSTEVGREHLWFPRGFQPDRALWRDSHSFFPKAFEDTRIKRTIPRPTIITWLETVKTYYDEWRVDQFPDTPSLVAAGIVNTQAKIHLWRLDRIPLPLNVLHEPERNGKVEEAVDYSEKTRGALRMAASTYARQVVGRLSRDPAPEDVTRELASLRFEARYWSALDLRFRDFLDDLDRSADPAATLDRWRRTLRRVATEAYFDATDAAGSDGTRMAAQALGSRTLQSQLTKALDTGDRTAA